MKKKEFVYNMRWPVGFNMDKIGRIINTLVDYNRGGAKFQNVLFFKFVYLVTINIYS